MGAAHVSAVYAQWSGLPDRPFRLLAYMALIAKDSTPEPTYWGGRDGLCIALGLDHTPTSYRIARRAVADLEAAGALRRTYVGHAGKRSEYRVILGSPKEDTTVPLSPVDNPHDAPDKGGHHSPPEGGHLSPQRGTDLTQKEDTTVPPRKMRNTRSDVEEENSPTKVSTDRACEPDDQPGISHLDAKRIVREYMDAGGVLDDLLADAPEGLTRTQRTRYAAAKITEAAS